MTPLNPVYAIAVYLIAFITAYIISIKYKIIPDNSRNENIDGLRGLLGLGVFIHHSQVWYLFLHSKKWTLPKSNLYSQLGQSSVALFFMITGFLFIGKLLNAKQKKLSWGRLYQSRIFRLLPMYLVSVGLIFVISLYATNWHLTVSKTAFAGQIFDWSAFTIPGSPIINNFQLSGIVNAGVAWSLTYEWLFYFSLPFIAIILLRNNNSIFYILLAVLFMVIYFQYNKIEIQHIISFAGGALAAFLARYKTQKLNFNSIYFSLAIIIGLIVLLQFKSSKAIVPKLVLVVIFNLIALGNSMFGFLRASFLKVLGEISYSTYLLHGILLFAAMYLLFGTDKAAMLSPAKYSLIIFIMTAILVIISFFGYYYVEKPFMDMAKKIDPGKWKNFWSNLALSKLLPSRLKQREEK